MRSLLPIICLIVLAGCGSSAAKPPTHVGLATYKDPVYGFSFKYPASYSVPPRGKNQNLQGVATYVLTINTHSQDAGIEITVDHQVIPFPAFTDGHVANDPSGGPDTLRYYHSTLSSWPAMSIQRFSGTRIDGYFLLANTHTLSYQVKMITAQPPFSSSSISGYNTITKSLRVPFS